MQNLPLYISIVFIITTMLTLGLFYKASGQSKIALTILIIWLTLQGAAGLTGFYQVTDRMPPRFMLLAVPPLLGIALLFMIPRGRQFLDGLNAGTLTILHIVRVPVEVVLFWLFAHHAVPQLITFEGRNFDVLSGLTAGIIYYFGYVKRQIGKWPLLIWNVLCLGLLINVVSMAILSAPFPFQKFGFEQPNVAILHFPFVWLPGFVVPVVLLSHLVNIRRLVLGK